LAQIAQLVLLINAYLVQMVNYQMDNAFLAHKEHILVAVSVLHAQHNVVHATMKQIAFHVLLIIILN
jgi:hypothetical protein